MKDLYDIMTARAPVSFHLSPQEDHERHSLWENLQALSIPFSICPNCASLEEQACPECEGTGFLQR